MGTPETETETPDTAAASGVAVDHRVLVEACGLIDRSERGKLALTGADAVEFLNGQVTNELAGLRPGEGRYAAFLTHKGKMLGDLRILVVSDGRADAGAPPELLLDTERAALQALFERTLERGLLSLIGPRAGEVASASELAEDEHANASVSVDEVAALAVRTDVGIDLLCDAEQTEALRARLVERGAQAVGGEAVECLRIESGRPRFGVDMDESTIPQEAGLNERAVSFTKGCYVGQETVARLHYRGKPNRHLRGLRLTAPAARGDALLLGEREVGRLGSVAVSPRLGAIALALVRREAAPGHVVAVGTSGATASVVELPFAAA